MISECPTALLNYKNIFEKDVEWGDMDAMQHVNNKRYFYYAESARLRWFNEIYSQLGVEYGGELKESFALAETSGKFKVPLTFPDTLLVATGVLFIEANQFILRHLIYSNQLACVAAEAEARMVRYDFINHCRADIPDNEISVLKKYQVPQD